MDGKKVGDEQNSEVCINWINQQYTGKHIQVLYHLNSFLVNILLYCVKLFIFCMKWATLGGVYVPCINRVPDGVIIGDLGPCYSVPIVCVRSIVQALLILFVC